MLSTRDLDLQSASRSILSSSRWSFRALPVAAAVLALASAAFGQSAKAVATTTTLTTPVRHQPATPPAKPSSPSTSRPHRNRQSPRQRHLARERWKRRQRQPAPFARLCVCRADGSATLTVSSLPADVHSRARRLQRHGELRGLHLRPADVTAEATAPDFSLSAAPATLNLDAGAAGHGRRHHRADQRLQ